MKHTATELLHTVEFYNMMLNAYANGMTEFECYGCEWNTDDVFMDFTKDLKLGLLKCSAAKNA